MGMGGSFLGTAASAAAGVIGGSLLLGGIRSMMGHNSGAHAAFDPSAGASSPWSGGSASGELAREAGVDDIGRTAGASQGASPNRDSGYGLLNDSGGDAPEEIEGADDTDDGPFDVDDSEASDQ